MPLVVLLLFENFADAADRVTVGYGDKDLVMVSDTNLDDLAKPTEVEEDAPVSHDETSAL